MPFPAPTEDNQPTDKVIHTWFNEDAQRVLYLKERADTVDSHINQDVKTTASPTFVDVILTGFGAIKSVITTLNSRVNQPLNTTSSPTFATVNSASVSTTAITTADIASTNGFSSDNVKVKHRLVTGVTNGFGEATASTGISGSIVLSIECFVQKTPTLWQTIYDSSDNKRVLNLDTSGFLTCIGGNDIAGLPFRALITYQG